MNWSSSSHTFSPLSVSRFLLLSGGVGSPCRGGEADGGARGRGEASGGENQVGSWRGRNGVTMHFHTVDQDSQRRQSPG